LETQGALGKRFPLYSFFSIPNRCPSLFKNPFSKNGRVAKSERRKTLAALRIYHELCKGVDECGICIYVCPKDVFKPCETLNQKGYRPPVVANQDQCTGCENCMIFCPDLAIVVSEEKMRRSAKK
jgi:2-oxoglutarate ferredoxin oxidoreductase subunit delta